MRYQADHVTEHGDGTDWDVIDTVTGRAVWTALDEHEARQTATDLNDPRTGTEARMLRGQV